jgi:hypothetical protein
MKLNPDCVRAVLLEVEDHSDYMHATEYKYGSTDFKRLKDFSKDEIAYHVQQCELSGLICGIAFYDAGATIDIRDLTPKGHEFLANIRNDTFFNKVKNIGKELGLNSLNDITQIALNCAALIIKNHFNLP